MAQAMKILTEFASHGTMVAHMAKKITDWRDQVLEQIRVQQARRDMKDGELARLIDISPGYWSDIRNKKRPLSLNVLASVCAQLGLAIALQEK